MASLWIQFKLFPNLKDGSVLGGQVNETIPLFGMHHLHRAKKDDIARNKWIDATIAAELAVKEVLIRAEPSIETLLLEMPSPPLDKLYGSILKTYLGEPSPYVMHIKKGVEIRNKLVHKPSKIDIELQDAIDYVGNIERAIFHLLSLLYPDDKLIDIFIKKTVCVKLSNTSKAPLK